ncbi:MAG: sacsin N-terminal ATP-binding-like domain-containing protein [Breznakibacter sp.]
MSFKQEIEKLIESNLKTYRDNSDRFIADYNRELELTKEYNGRQLLELLQNADDAVSKEVLIVWDKENSKLTISNKGEPFETGGIKSLMLANLSTKTKITYIGNKGLGFRSILNWAEQINISSNGCIISFSELIAKDVFENRLSLTVAQKQQLRLERNLAEQTVPFPVLAIPIIKENGHLNDWTTAIEITYRKEFEPDIETQLIELREEILLFLNNIQKITIVKGIETLELQSVKKSVENHDSISIKDKKWKVFSRENILPEEYQDKSKNEQQSYSLKVAFQEDLSDNYKKLFNFFPTQLSISLPCIIHGTFELNSSRNHLNESKKNEYILKELVQLLKDCALYLTEQRVDWRPYKLISPSSTASDSKLIEAFYKQLESLKQAEKIYPCISNVYHHLEHAAYYSDEFNGFFQEHFPEYLPQLLMPLNNDVNTNFTKRTFKHDFLVEKIDTLSATELSASIRAELIAQLSKTITFKDEQERFSLLVNESGKIIPKEDLAFTPVLRSEESFHIPKSVKVDFMKSELYDLLISKFENEFDKKEPKSREIQRIIKSVVNLQPYDSNNVIDKIITGTKDALKSLEDIESRINCIKEMVSALYANFKNIENRQEKLKISVPLISKAGIICDAEELYLSKSYPSGELTEIIYDEVLKANDYIVSMDFWILKDNDFDSIESFFLWLGINKHSKVTTINLQNNWAEKEYIDFIFTNGTDKPDNFEINRIQKDSIVSKIENFDDIKKISINKIILLALKDTSIRKLLETNEEKISWYYVTWRPAIHTSYSYLRYQFLKSNLFTKYVLEEGGEDLNNLINEDFQIDYNFLGQYGINKTEVKSILIKLGAKESFNDITPENVYEILKAIPQKDINKKGKATQTLYKMALESLVKQGSTFPIPDNIEYFSRKAGEEEYYPRNEVYYSDNSILPRKIVDTLPLLNLPKRIGEDNVERYFGVKSLREFKIHINEQNIQFNSCDADLNRLFESLKPYLLAYRLDSPNLKKRITDYDTKRKEAKIIKQSRIHVVTHCLFRFGDDDEIPIDAKEFINVKDNFYYKESSLHTVDGLKKDSLFCDAFAEMMCIIFKVNDIKNDFRQILKNDIHDTIHLAQQDLGSETIEEAFELLGVSRIEIDFWKNVFTLKNKQLSESIETTEILKQKVLESLNIELGRGYENIDFEHFANNESLDLIALLSNGLNLSVKQLLPQGLYNYHKKQFIACLKDNEYKFKQQVWSTLNINSDKQSSFISILNNYSIYFITQLDSELHSCKFELKVDYFSIIKSQIQKHFKIDIASSNSENIDIQNLYKDVLQKYSLEEVDIADESIRSLLYFEGNSEKIESHILQQFGNEEEDGNTNKAESKVIGALVDASLSKNGKTLQVSPGNEKGSWVHSGHSDKGKQRIGKKAELLVYNTLVDKYGLENVKWVSGNSITPDKNDKLHYDLEYKNEAGEWKYLEVKAMSDNQFIISGPEKDKGIAEPDKFEMALVKDNTIYMVKDIFKFKQGETFESNSKFVAFAKDYVFVFDLDNIKN